MLAKDCSAGGWAGVGLDKRTEAAVVVVVVEIRKERIARRVFGIDAVMGVAVDVVGSSFWAKIRAFRWCEEGD